MVVIENTSGRWPKEISMFTIIGGTVVGLAMAAVAIWYIKNKTKILSPPTVAAPVAKTEQQLFDEHILSLQEQLGKDREHLHELQQRVAKNRGMLAFQETKKVQISQEVSQIAADPNQAARCEELRKSFRKVAARLSSLTKEIAEDEGDVASLVVLVEARSNEISDLKRDWERLRSREKTLAIKAQAGDADLGTGGPEARDTVLRLLEDSRRNNIALSARVNLNSDLGAATGQPKMTVADSEFDRLMEEARASKSGESDASPQKIQE